MNGFRVNWDDSKARAIVETGGQSAIRDCANLLLDESRKQVPLDTGALSRSGAVSSEGLQATVSYDTPYAVRQHESMTYRHAAGRKAKYLEDPCNSPALRERLIEYVKSNIKF